MTISANDFVDLALAVPGLQVDARYAGSNNFTGRPVPGYEAGRLVVSKPAALALASVQDGLADVGLGLKVFDAYRPQRAVDHFLAWTAEADDPELKRRFYPRIAKNRLFELGLLVGRSSHSRGSTVDLTLVDDSGAELDMGTPFDFFDDSSRGDSLSVSVQQRANRLLLASVMTRGGFVPLAEEWWHFTLGDEPYPDTCFDFVVS